MKITTRSAKETKKTASLLAEAILESETKEPVVIGLVGDLGSGKTTFIQGFARGLKIKKRLTSPTFLIIKQCKLPNQKSRIMKYETLYHIDAYRLKSPRELSTLGFKKIVSDPKNIVVIEWADRIRRILPKQMVWINFKHGKKESERVIEFEPST